LSPDHIERHKTLKKYIKSKFKLLKNQLKNHLAFVKKNDLLIKKEINSNSFNSKIFEIEIKGIDNFLKNIENNYFLTETNKENLSFVIAISKQLKLKKNLLIETIENFSGLKYRQQIILRRKYLTIINDSKSTSFSSSIGVLKANKNIYWLLGGIYKKGDKFNLPKKYFSNIKAYIYGNNKKFFNNKLKGKIKYKNFDNLKNAIKNILRNIKKEKSINKTILFSPCAASFDSFKNFEDRGFYFNKMINKYFHGKQ
jgi:UDP-N-acetylmuramoylalanine--D-glutamate ligase